MNISTKQNRVVSASVGTFVRTGRSHHVGYRLAENGCWLWAAGCDPNGYGQAFNHRLGRTDKAHRVIWERYKGALPARESGAKDWLELDHLCRNRACVNPDHLELVSHRENQRRMRRTHCRRGHEYTPESTAVYRRPSGLEYRVCLLCVGGGES